MVKFLVIRFSSIGDIVLTTPVIRCLKQQVEGASVHFLTKEAFSSVLDGNPYIDKQYTLKDNYSELLAQLKEESYDYIIDLHKNLRTFRIRNALKRQTFSFDKINRQKWLMVKFKRDHLPKEHIVDRYFEAVKAFSVENDKLGLDYFINNKENEQIFKETGTDDYIVFVVGAKHKTKQIPVDIAKEIINGLDKKVVLIGGKDDVDQASEIVSGMEKDVLNTTGSYSLFQSAALIKCAYAIITPDTGMMHIASAFKKPVISLWGNTIPEFGMYPYIPGEKSKMFQVADLKCRPCSKLGFDKCPKKHFDCMMKQNVKGIVKYVNTLTGEL